MSDPDPLAAPRASRTFARRILRAYADAELTSMIHLGHVLGLWGALAEGPGTAEEVADRAKLDRRYVREWLSAVAAARVVRFDPVQRTFTLPTSRARVLVGESVYNVAPGSRMVTMGAKNLGAITRAFRTGAGVPYAAFLPEFPEIMFDMNRRRYDALLVSHYVPLVPGLRARLARGIRVLDVGTGSGHPLNLLARAFPRSRFVGIDPAPQPLARARAEAKDWNLENVRYLRVDAARTARQAASYDLVTMFDAIHDLSEPEPVLCGVRRSLRAGGVLLAVEPRAHTDLAENIGRTGAAFLYGVSVTYCLPVSRSDGKGGLGTCWGAEQAVALLRECGFGRVRVTEAPGNALAAVFVAHAPGRGRVPA